MGAAAPWGHQYYPLRNETILTPEIPALQKHEQIMYHLPLLYRKVGAQSPDELSTVRMSTP